MSQFLNVLGGGAPQTLGAVSITPGSGTGVTVNTTATFNRTVYKVTADYTAFSAAALTADLVIATLPAKMKLCSIVCDVTTKFIGGAISAATMIVGHATNNNGLIVGFDIFTAAVTKGLADADLGTDINRASAIQGGYTGSWTATTPVSVRVTTVTANTNALTQGSATWYIEVEQAP